MLHEATSESRGRMVKRRSKGEGTLYKNAKGLWVAQVTLPDGERKTKYSKDQKVAREWILAERKSLQDGVIVHGEKITLELFLRDYIANTLTQTVRPKTLESYTYLIEKHIIPTLGYLKLTQIRPSHLQGLYAAKLEEGLSKRTVQYIHAVLHKALKQALKWCLTARNVADLVDPPHPDKSPISTFTLEQSKIFLNLIRQDRLYPFYAVAIGGGLRLGELLALEWSNVDLEKGEVRITQSLQYIPEQGVVYGEPKTDSGRRSITLPDFCIQALAEQRTKSDSTGLVFATKNGTPFSHRNIERHFHSILKKGGLPDMRFHDLRHTSATLLLLAGVHPKVVQERLGHSKISITLDTYSHVIPSMQKEAADKMNKIFK